MILKRAVDIAGAFTGLAILSPIIAASALAVWITMGRPIFFRQERPGLDGRLFRMVKFRTMSQTFDAGGKLLPDGQRITRTGQILRSTSLDELPELWNVLVGEMSLVGPRPLLKVYLDRYSPEQARRHNVKPGITGWAQVNGRNAISWDEKFSLDIWYIDNMSFFVDLKIIFLTLIQAARRENINSIHSDTMPEFLGENNIP